MDIAIVGATGFVGSHLVPHLVEAGNRVIAISRSGRRLPNWTDAVEARAADVTTAAGLEEALAGADAVVHLVAIPRESKGRRFDEVNVQGTRNVVEAAHRAGIRRFVHLSVLGVADDRKLAYLWSKWQGEQAVRTSSLDWVVLRPSLMFGEGDGFFNLVKATLRSWSPGVVAIPGSGDARFQPLSVDDLAIAVERCLTDADRGGSVYELGGPDWLDIPADRRRGHARHPHSPAKAPDADPSHQRAHLGHRQGPARLPGQPRPDQLAAAPELHGARCIREGVRRHAAQTGPRVPRMTDDSPVGRVNVARKDGGGPPPPRFDP